VQLASVKVQMIERFQSALLPPQDGFVAMCMRPRRDLFHLSTGEDVIGEGSRPSSSISYAVHDVITQILGGLDLLGT